MARQDPLVNAFARILRDRPEVTLVASPRSACTVRDVAEMGRCLTARLNRVGLSPGSVLGIRAPNGPGFLAALLGCRDAGCVALLLDSGAPDSAVDRALARLGAVGRIGLRKSWPERVDDIDVAMLANRQPTVFPPERHAVIKLTSGSTGEARGIVTSSEALLADDEALAATMGIDAQDRLIAAVPFSHSYGLSSLVVAALARGVTLIVPEGHGPFQPLESAKVCEGTVFPTAPAYLTSLLRLQTPPAIPPSVRRIISAGAPLLPEVAQRFRSRFGRRIHVFYGASECGGITYDRTGEAAMRGTVGTPVDGVRVELATDDDRLATDSGRVRVTSPAVAEFYFPESDSCLQHGRFVAEDLGTWIQGELSLVGRLNDLINVKGQKVNPVEVERVLRELPGVDDAKVFGVHAPNSGSDVVRAVVASRTTVPVEEIVAWCRARLAEYKVPRRIAVVDRLPVTDRGKLDRSRLAAIAATEVTTRGSQD